MMDLMRQFLEIHHCILTTMRKLLATGWVPVANTNATNLKDKASVSSLIVGIEM
jgi:hypothetical protein